jgi:hypothetical protein
MWDEIHSVNLKGMYPGCQGLFRPSSNAAVAVSPLQPQH